MPAGLSNTEAQERLKQYGPNQVPEEKRHPAIDLLKKFWGPVPWMLEAALVLELVIGHNTQAFVIGCLLVFNALISFFQENRAQNALALLQKRLSIQVRVLRDGSWETLTANQLVPGDVIRLRVGDFVPADVQLSEGHISVDFSTLTGETLPAEQGPGDKAYAGGVLQRGEATGEVVATGLKTYFGKTAELVHVAKTASHLETTILSIVKYLVALDVLLVIGVLIYAWINAVSFQDAVPFALILLIASVPVALPATFTLASALGSQDLAKHGVLVTRLSAIEEAAAMDVLCSDKTGTITKNSLVLGQVHAYAPYTEETALHLAALGSDEASQDPIDLAIIRAAKERGLGADDTHRLEFVPFDPSTKRTEATLQVDHKVISVIKGMPQVVTSLVVNCPEYEKDVEGLASQGYRVLAVASGSEPNMELVGLVGLYDPPREDSAKLIQNLKDLAVRIVMVTGDGIETARAIAAQVGLGNKACTASQLHNGNGHIQDEFSCDVIAGVLPEDKYDLVRGFQKQGHVTGMTGDGVNDAPALKQAEVGIAVSNATDVARAAASVVLTEPGLSNVLDAVKIGRQIYQRMLSYTYNKIIKTFQIALFLSLGLFLAGIFVTTPRLIVLLLFANDFVTMSLAADRVTYSRKPDRWNIRPLVTGSLVMAAAWLLFSFGILYLGRDVYQLGINRLQTLIFVMLVFTGQANVYLVRERGHFWRSRPGTALMISSLGDLIVITTLATQGILMAPIALTQVLMLLAMVIFFGIVLDQVKVGVLHRAGLST
jgi:H+-transporting ATPase